MRRSLMGGNAASFPKTQLPRVATNEENKETITSSSYIFTSSYSSLLVTADLY